MNAEALRQLDPPEQPGVYLMKDSHAKIIYIGKALSLKKRLASYFRSADQLDPKTQVLVAHIAEIEWVVTDSEEEALMLEYNLIKKHRPRYNVLMRDDKSYPYLKLTVQEPFPRLLMTRRPFIDAARYFGPFTTTSVRDVARIISRHYRLCFCKRPPTDSGRRERCLYYQMGQCDGACLGQITPENYAARVQLLQGFLEGGTDPITPLVQVQMEQASEAMEYELAASLRDQLQALEAVRHQPVLASTGREHRDCIGLARSGTAATVEVFQVRTGNLESRRHFFLSHVGADPIDDLTSQVLIQYYAQPVPLPPEVLLAHLPEDAEWIQRWLSRRRQGPVQLRLPQNEDETRLLKMAEANAWLYLKSNVGSLPGELTDEDRDLLLDLGRRLNLSGPPRVIEGYDISNISGKLPVGSRVVFTNGQPDTARYRRYRIQTVTGPNDFAMLQEVLYRRFKRLKEEREQPPDLIVVDGGAGQLSAALAVLRELELDHLPVIGLAKKEEEIYQPNRSEPLLLPKTSASLKLLTRLRDEAHRFAVTYHRRLRSQRLQVSKLDQVRGVGPVKRRELLKAFGSVDAILQVPEVELATFPGIGSELAKKIIKTLKS